MAAHPARARVRTVKSNWKARDPQGWDITIADLTVLRGGTGTGKSAVVEALEWTLSGSVAGFMGRTKPVAAARMVWRARPPGAKVLWCEVTMADGTVVRREQRTQAQRSPSWTITTADGMTHVTDTAPGVTLRVRDLRAALYGSAASAESWLAAHLGIDDDLVYASALLHAATDDVQQTVADAVDAQAFPPAPTLAARILAAEPTQHAALFGVLGIMLPADTSILAALSCLCDDAVAETLIAGMTAHATPDKALAAIKKAARAAAKEADAAESVAEAVAEQAGTPVTLQMLADAEAAVRRAEQGAEHAQQVDAHARVLYDGWQEQAVLQHEVAGLPPVPQDAAERVARHDFAAKILAAVEAAQEANPQAPGARGLCPCCKDVRGVGIDYAARAEELRAFMVQSSALARNVATRERVEARTAALRAQMQQAWSALAQADPSACQQIQTGTFRWRAPTQDAVLAQARADLDTLRRRAVAFKGPEIAGGVCTDARDRAEVLALAADALAKAISSEVGVRVAALERAANAHFPERLGKIRVAVRPEVAVAVTRRGARRSTLPVPSGGEEAVMLLALGAALGPDQADAPFVLVGEDRQIDEGAVAATLDAFAAWSEGQIILTLVPDLIPDDVPEPWTVVDVEEDVEGVANDETVDGDGVVDDKTADEQAASPIASPAAQAVEATLTRVGDDLSDILQALTPAHGDGDDGVREL